MRSLLLSILWLQSNVTTSSTPYSVEVTELTAQISIVLPESLGLTWSTVVVFNFDSSVHGLLNPILSRLLFSPFLLLEFVMRKAREERLGGVVATG